MSTTIANFGHGAVAAEHSRPAYQAYQILHFAFTVAPILATATRATMCPTN